MPTVLPLLQKTSVNVAFWGLAQLPLPILHGIGHGVGWLLSRSQSKLVRDAKTNLQWCLPALGGKQHNKLQQDSLQHWACALLESPKLWRASWENIQQKIKFIHNIEYLQNSLNEKKGVILLTPHLGAWEIAGLFCAKQAPLTSLYKSIEKDESQSAIDGVMKQGREHTGARLVPSTAQGVRELLLALKRGEMVGILPDQDPPWGSGVFAPFFGWQAHTPALIAKLAQRTGVPIVALYAERLSYGRGYAIHFLPPFYLSKSLSSEAALARVNQAVESCILACPEQYWWSYRRFRRQAHGHNPYNNGTPERAQ